jgi:hypothetical protein
MLADTKIEDLEDQSESVTSVGISITPTLSAIRKSITPTPADSKNTGKT